MATPTLIDVVGNSNSTQRFLNVVIELHAAAVAIHNTHQCCDYNISQLSGTLATTVERLRGEVTRDGNANILPRTCVKLGQDLLLRLNRVKAALESKSPETDLRAVWPAAAVEALGDRITILQSQWSIST